ncbi:MAG: glycoside hydrolase domain-containing protein [Verrucomicrobiota bacterium]
MKYNKKCRFSAKRRIFVRFPAWRVAALVLLVAGAAFAESNLLFSINFDGNSLAPQVALGDPTPDVQGTFRFEPGFVGEAAVFENTNYLRFKPPGNYDPDTGTIEMRFKQFPITDDYYHRILVSFYTDISERFHLKQTSEEDFVMFFTGMGGGGTVSFPFSDNPTGSWHHIAVCWQKHPVDNKTHLRIYLDGQKKVDQDMYMVLPAFTGTNSRFSFGSYYYGEQTLNGLIDEFKIYDYEVYTAESYPDLFLYPSVDGFEERFLQITNAVEFVPDPVQKQAAQDQCALLDARIQDLKNGTVTGEAYFVEYDLVDSELQELWEYPASPALWWKDRPAEEFGVLPVSCMRKVNDRWSNAPLEAELPELVMCGNEWGAFQVAILPRFTNVNDCTVVLGDMVGPNGAISSSNIDIFKIGTVMQEGNTKDAWADPIFPLEGSFSVPKEKVQSLWIQVYVPEGTAPGEYNGTVTVASGTISEDIPVVLHVHGFALPVKPRLQTAFGFVMTPLVDYYSGMDHEPIADRYLENMLKHRVSIKSNWLNGMYYDTLFLSPMIMKNADGTWSMDFWDYDRQLVELLPLGLNSIMVGFRGWDGNYRSVANKSEAVREFPYYDVGDGWKLKRLELPVISPETEAFGKWVIQTWYDHLVAMGLGGMAYTYFVDEPSSDMMDMINTICEWSHDVAPDLENMITSEPSASAPNVDIWCPLTVTPDVISYEESGGTIWKYVCVAPPSPCPNFFVSQTALENRLPLWEGYKAGATGFAYYETGRSLYFENDGDNVWPLRWQNSPGSEGDGFLVYPGADGPINTIRFEYVRMGIQDVEYFLMLEDLLKDLPAEHPLRDQAEALLVVDDSLMEGFGCDYNADWGAFQQRKDDIGVLIEEAMYELFGCRTETFESYASGFAMPGTNGWSAALSTDAVVVTNADSIAALNAYDEGCGLPVSTNHDKVLKVNGTVTDGFSIEEVGEVLWVDFMNQALRLESIDNSLLDSAQAAFYFNAGGHPMVWHHDVAGASNRWVEIPEVTMPDGEWVRVTFKLDYQTVDTLNYVKYFQMRINGFPLTNALAWTANDGAGSGGGSWFAMPGEPATMSRFIIDGYGADIDDLVVTTNNPLARDVVIASAHGQADPAVGTHSHTYGDSVGLSVLDSPFSQGINQFVCTGWDMSGHAPESGSGTNMTTILTNDLALTWLWDTNNTLAPMGTPEWWLAMHGLTNGTFAEEELLDDDNDGVLSWQEWVCDTIPADSNSVLKITGIDSAEPGMQLHWSGGMQATQQLERCTNLVSGLWVPVFTNEPPTAVTNSFNDSSATNQAEYYRVRAWR